MSKNKKGYTRKPRLAAYGSIREITQTGGTTSNKNDSAIPGTGKDKTG